MANPTKESVLESIKEYDEIGLDAFEKKYGTGKKSYYDILYNEKTVIRLDIGKSDIPIFANFNKTKDKNQDDPKFFIRTGAATRKLKGRDLIDYQKKVFD